MFPTIFNFKYFHFLFFKTCIYHLFSMSVCVINHVISRLKNSNLLTKNLSKYDFPLKIEQEMIVYIFYSLTANTRENFLEKIYLNVSDSPARAH